MPPDTRPPPNPAPRRPTVPTDIRTLLDRATEPVDAPPPDFAALARRGVRRRHRTRAAGVAALVAATGLTTLAIGDTVDRARPGIALSGGATAAPTPPPAFAPVVPADLGVPLRLTLVNGTGEPEAVADRLRADPAVQVAVADGGVTPARLYEVFGPDLPDMALPVTVDVRLEPSADLSAFAARWFGDPVVGVEPELPLRVTMDPGAGDAAAVDRLLDADPWIHSWTRGGDREGRTVWAAEFTNPAAREETAAALRALGADVEGRDLGSWGDEARESIGLPHRVPLAVVPHQSRRAEVVEALRVDPAVADLDDRGDAGYTLTVARTDRVAFTDRHAAPGVRVEGRHTVALRLPADPAPDLVGRAVLEVVQDRTVIHGAVTGATVTAEYGSLRDARLAADRFAEALPGTRVTGP